MRRIFAMVTALLLVLGLVGPAGAFDGGPQIDHVTIGSAVVDRSGNVQIRGTMYCDPDMDVQIQDGQVKQVIGRTTSILGSFGGRYSCNGTAPWESGASASNGKFAPGWATISVKFEGTWCDENGCDQHAWGGTEQYLKIVRAR